MTGRPWIAVLLVIFSLLIFTTVYTSPLSAGDGTTLSKAAPKQRQSTLPDLAWSRPVLQLSALVPVARGEVYCVESDDAYSTPFFGRYFDLPPPSLA